MNPSSHALPPRSDGLHFAKLYFFAALIMSLAELIGSATFNVGPGKVVLLPMIWALLIGATLGLLKERLPAPLRIDTGLQFNAALILQPALLLFVAKLGLLVGASLPKIAASGWALVFQEFGHFVGTILIGLPWRCCWASSVKRLAPPSRSGANPAWPSSARSTAWTRPKAVACWPST